jgi:hypothetical protein
MGKHPITAIVAGLVVAAFGTALAVRAGADEAKPNQALTFYGVEMKRQDNITLKEAKNFARSHGQANYVISKTPLVNYEGTGDVILSSYGLDRAEQEKLAATIPGKGKILEINVLPSVMSTKKGVGVYKLPIVRTEDSIGGDVWVQAGSNPPQMLAKAVMISTTRPRVSNLFKFVGFADNESALAYCLEDCTRFDLVSGNKTPLAPTNKVDAAGIHTSVDDLLGKQGVANCRSQMTVDIIQNVDKNGFYRGFCPTKGDQALEVQLRKSSGSWKVVNSSWLQPQTVK